MPPVASGVHREEPDGAQQSAQTKRAHGETEETGILVKDVSHDHRAEGDERRAQHTRREHREKRTAQVRIARDGADTREQLTPIEGPGGRRRRFPARENPQRNGDERHVRRCAHHETSHRADAGHQNASQGRPQNSGEIELGRIQREARWDLFAFNDGWQDGLKRRHGERVRDAHHQREDDHHPRPHRSHQQKHNQQCWAQHLDRLKCRDHAATVGAVRQHASHQGQEQRRRA